MTPNSNCVLVKPVKNSKFKHINDIKLNSIATSQLALAKTVKSTSHPLLFSPPWSTGISLSPPKKKKRQYSNQSSMITSPHVTSKRFSP